MFSRISSHRKYKYSVIRCLYNKAYLFFYQMKSEKKTVHYCNKCLQNLDVLQFKCKGRKIKQYWNHRHKELFLFNISIFVSYVAIPPMVVHNLIHVSQSMPFGILIYAHYKKTTDPLCIK